MRLTKSLLSVIAALALATGMAFANESMPMSSIETTDQAYFEQSELASGPTMIDPITEANTGSTVEAYDVYYVYPVEVVEVQEIWLVPSIDTESPQG